MISRIVKQGGFPPTNELNFLAWSLNHLDHVWHSAGSSKTTADSVRGAIDVLLEFFELRQSSWPTKQTSPRSEEILENERQLYSAFQDFISMFRNHGFELDMDADLVVPSFDSWRHMAGNIGDWFAYAMSQARPPVSIGISNDGPRARFVAAVLLLITGKEQTIANVAVQLKNDARQVKRAFRPSREPRRGDIVSLQMYRDKTRK